jgi:hypothetical protein
LRAASRASAAGGQGYWLRLKAVGCPTSQNLTLDTVARQVGVPMITVSRLERGHQRNDTSQTTTAVGSPPLDFLTGTGASTRGEFRASMGGPRHGFDWSVQYESHCSTTKISQCPTASRMVAGSSLNSPTNMRAGNCGCGRHPGRYTGGCVEQPGRSPSSASLERWSTAWAVSSDAWPRDFG